MASGVRLSSLPARVFGRVAAVVAAAAANRSATNVFWNLIGGVWAGVLVVTATPWFVARLGLEGYGVVGVWLVLQGIMGLLDVGMGVTVVKSFAAAPPGNDGRAYRRDVLRTLEIFYWSGAILLSGALLLGSDWLGRHWLRSSTIAPDDLVSAVRVMALALGLQFPIALYSNGFAGIQEQGRMNALQIAGNTLRYGGGALVLVWTTNVLGFFIVQAAVAGVQTLLTRFVLLQRMSVPGDTAAAIRFDLLKPLLRYSSGMAANSVAAVLMSNADRLVLSVVSTTAELGKYAVAFTASGLLQLGIQPFYRAFFPRFAELVAAESADALQREYFRGCTLMAMLIVPLGVVGFVFAPELIDAWLRDRDSTVVAVFRLLLVGITCGGLTWLPAAFQQAHGWTGLHTSMVAGALLLGSVIMPWAISAFGTVGATVVWVLHGFSGLTVELWLMHRKLLPGRLFEWYRAVFLPPLIVSLVISLVSRWLFPDSFDRVATLAWVGATGLLIVTTLLATLYRRDGAVPAPSEIVQGN